MSILILNVPCSKLVTHAPHPITVVNPWSPTLLYTLSCPGWAPSFASISANPDPVVPSS